MVDRQEREGSSSPRAPAAPDVTTLMLADPRRALQWAGALAVGALVMCGLMWWTDARSVVQWVDDQFLELMERLRWTPTVQLAKVLAFIGGALCTWLIRAVVLAVLVGRQHWLHLSAFMLAIITSELCIGPLKALYERPRPPGSLIETSGYSFPSGHAIAAAVTAMGIVIVLMHPGHTRWVWERRAAMYASLMALSRTYLNAHWLSDVVAGALIGSALAIGWPALLVMWRARASRLPERATPEET
jgi:undecaprenyl-diphosphatase